MRVKKKAIFSLFQKVLTWIKKNKLLSLLIFFAFITNLSITVFNGIRICMKDVCGLYVGGLHFHDSWWHLGISSVSFNQFPFILPNFSGEKLFGYHYFIDLIIFLISKLGFSGLTIYFRIIPLLFIGLLSYFSYKFVKNVSSNKTIQNSILFFIFFGSSFSYILSLYHFKTLKSFFYSQAMQSGRSLLNLPYAMSIVLILGLLVYIQKKNKFTVLETLIIGLLVFFITSVKFYAGITILVLLATYTFIYALKNQKVLYFLLSNLVFMLFFLISVFIFLDPIKSFKSGSTFILSPFAIVHPLIEERDQFYLPNLVNARYFLYSTKVFSLRLLTIELFSTMIFIVFNAGTRIIGLFYLLKRVFTRKLNQLEISFFITIMVTSGLTFLFIQKGEWWNIIQFFGYTLFFLNYFAGLGLASSLNSRKIIIVAMGMVIILLTLPTNIEQVSFAGERNISIKEEELQALSILRDKKDGVVLSLPIQQTAYISYFSNKQLYYADEAMLNGVQVDSKTRKKEMIDPVKIDYRKAKIRYIYIQKKASNISENIFKEKGFSEIFENSEVILFEKK